MCVCACFVSLEGLSICTGKDLPAHVFLCLTVSQQQQFSPPVCPEEEAGAVRCDGSVGFAALGIPQTVGVQRDGFG